MRGLWGKGEKFCFSRRTGVRWVEAMFHELDIVLENLRAVLEQLPEYINPLFVLKQLFAFSFSGSFLSVFVFVCGVSACEHQARWETRTTGDRRTCREWQQP